MRFVSIEDARPGMCLAYDLYDSMGRTMVGSGWISFSSLPAVSAGLPCSSFNIILPLFLVFCTHHTPLFCICIEISA